MQKVQKVEVECPKCGEHMVLRGEYYECPDFEEGDVGCGERVPADEVCPNCGSVGNAECWQNCGINDCGDYTCLCNDCGHRWIA